MILFNEGGDKMEPKRKPIEAATKFVEKISQTVKVLF